MRRRVATVGIRSIEAIEGLLHAVFAKRSEAYHLSMTTIHPECPDSDPSDLLVAADVLLRQEPDKEEEEDDDDDKEDEKEDEYDDDTTDDG